MRKRTIFVPCCIEALTRLVTLDPTQIVARFQRYLAHGGPAVRRDFIDATVGF
jgi:hypothetical protein